MTDNSTAPTGLSVDEKAALSAWVQQAEIANVAKELHIRIGTISSALSGAPVRPASLQIIRLGLRARGAEAAQEKAP